METVTDDGRALHEQREAAAAEPIAAPEAVPAATADALPAKDGSKHREVGFHIKRTAGGPISPMTFTSLFIRLERTTGLRGGKWEPGVTLHGLRHRFAVRSLEQAFGTDRDNISRRVLALSTWMGHVGVDSMP